jgi:large subunit ribosomal protein L22
MEAKSIQRHVRIAPRKMRVVANLIRNKPVTTALEALSLTPKKAALVVKKALSSAVANVQQKGEVDIDALVVTRIFVDEGPTMRRFKPRAMGRATRINKRTSHLTVEVAEL